jgi:phosphinothricin acetyltransferase
MTKRKRMSVTIRPATPADLPHIVRIYAPAVLTGSSSFELEPPDHMEIGRRMKSVLEGGYPYLAAEIGGRFAGYAYASTYRARPAYRFSVEDSIYIDPDLQRRGVGRALLTALIAACETRGFRQMLAVIGDSPNQPGSVGLHEACGFRVVGQLPAIGYKFGRWVDTLLMQRELGEGMRTKP